MAEWSFRQFLKDDFYIILYYITQCFYISLLVMTQNGPKKLWRADILSANLKSISCRMSFHQLSESKDRQLESFTWLHSEHSLA